MRRMMLTLGLSVLLICGQAQSADIYGLSKGTPEIKSPGPITFGPDGILFIGDPQGAAVFAVQTGDQKGEPAKASHQVDALNEALTQAFGAKATVEDLAVNPQSGNAFVLVAVAGKGVHLAKVSGNTVTPLPLKDVPFARKELSDAPEDAEVQVGNRRRNLRGESITDLKWVEGEIIVSGTRKGSATSGVRTMVFPFNEADKGAALEIYHAAHGRSEDYAVIRTFVPFIINGEPNLLAGFVCTPLVRFPVSAVESGEKIIGTTVAELGNRNRPLDMIVYEKAGKRYLLLSNSARGVMKVSTEDIEKNEGLTKPVSGGGTAGQPYETVASWTNVVQLDKLNDTHAVIIVQDGDQFDLKTVELP